MHHYHSSRLSCYFLSQPSILSQVSELLKGVFNFVLYATQNQYGSSIDKSRLISTNSQNILNSILSPQFVVLKFVIRFAAKIVIVQAKNWSHLTNIVTRFAAQKLSSSKLEIGHIPLTSWRASQLKFSVSSSKHTPPP